MRSAKIDLIDQAIDVIAYDPEKHFEILQSWRRGHELNPYSKEDLPEFGFLAWSKGIYYAAAFLRRVEAGPYALLDSLIANPKTFGKIRYFSINDVVQTCIEKSRELGFREIFALSVDVGTLKRSQKFGFLILPHVSIVLPLEQEAERTARGEFR